MTSFEFQKAHSDSSGRMMDELGQKHTELPLEEERLQRGPFRRGDEAPSSPHENNEVS